MSTHSDTDLKIDGATVAIAEAGIVTLGSGEKEAVKDILHDELTLTPEQNRRILRKADTYVLPLMMVCYGLQYIDKVSLALGAAFGLFTDTKLVGQDFSWLTTIFYLGNMIAQFPLQYAMQRLPLGRTLSVLLLTWGALVMCLAACNTFSQLMAVRFFLGIAEGAITPGFSIMIGSWYKQPEQMQRQFCYFSMNAFFTLWSTVVIYYIGVNATNHPNGLSGWRVINLFLGAMTVFFGVISIIVFGQPSKVWWLTAEEKRLAHARVLANGGGSGENNSWKWDQAVDTLKDPNSWMTALISFLICVPNGGLTTFGTLIYEGFGFSALDSVLYQLPGTAIGFVYIASTAVIVMYYPKLNFPIQAFSLVPPFAVLIAVGTLPFTPNYTWTKWGLYLPVGIFATTIWLNWGLLPTNFAGRTKRSCVTGLSLLMYCVGNMVGAQTFQASDAPHYTRGLTATGVIFGVMILVVLLQWWYLRNKNAKRAKVLAEMGVSEEERILRCKVEGELDVTDNKNIYFRYTC